MDGTDCPIQEPTKFDSSFYSHKIKAAALRYEVGVAIQTGDIVWVNGPFKCGAFPDLKIFRSKLKYRLDPGEFVEADNGYRGEPLCVRVASCFVSKTDKRAKAKARARHETVNRHFKKLGVLSKVFQHKKLEKHKICFFSVATIEQIANNIGHKSYSVTY